MSNRLYAKERHDIVREVGELNFSDRQEIIRQAEIARGEEFARLVGKLWRVTRDGVRRLIGTLQGGRDTELSELDEHTLADLGLKRGQVPGFIAKQLAAAQAVANQNKHDRTPADAA